MLTMSFQIPDEVNKLKEELVASYKDEVRPVRCSNCGASTFMNAIYAKHITEISSCGKCR